MGDACPTVVLEAMAAGRPVVASASGGIVDLVVDGVTGLLVAPGDVSALAQAISSVLRDPRAAQAFGAAGRDRAREFTVSAVVERIERLYASAIAETREVITRCWLGCSPVRACWRRVWQAPQDRADGLGT